MPPAMPTSSSTSSRQPLPLGWIAASGFALVAGLAVTALVVANRQVQSARADARLQLLQVEALEHELASEALISTAADQQFRHTAAGVHTSAIAWLRTADSPLTVPVGWSDALGSGQLLLPSAYVATDDSLVFEVTIGADETAQIRRGPHDRVLGFHIPEPAQPPTELRLTIRPRDHPTGVPLWQGQGSFER